MVQRAAFLNLHVAAIFRPSRFLGPKSQKVYSSYWRHPFPHTNKKRAQCPAAEKEKEVGGNPVN
jgi:hypothetical protein